MSDHRKLIVIPLGGLGNRMRVIASCVEVARKEKRDLWIVWSKDKFLGCELEEIFQNLGMEYKTFSKWQSAIFKALYRHGGILKFQKVYKLFSNFIFGASIFDFDIENESYKGQAYVHEATILVSTCYGFGTLQGLNDSIELNNKALFDAYALFSFTEEIQNRIKNEISKISEPYIGIHVRRTDHVMIIKNSPVESYISKIKELVYAKTEQKFFLATDDLEVKSNLLALFPNNIYTLELKLGRGDQEGMYAGVIELALLSRSTSLICSKLSSFSSTAILLGNIRNIYYV